jgi:hypothetical protein
MDIRLIVLPGLVLRVTFHRSQSGQDVDELAKVAYAFSVARRRRDP